jgi:hypothetical protein
MQGRLIHYIASLAMCFCVSCNKQSAQPSAETPSPAKVYKAERRLEGYPVAVITAQQDYKTKITTAKHWSLGGAQAVVTLTRTWNGKKPITVAFQGGSQALKSQIAKSAALWTEHASVQLDFGAPKTFREWKSTDTTYAADIRIAFQGGAAGGYWSLVGRDSINPALAKANEASMNFEGFPDGLPEDSEAIILHEFGHALGFDHEHQSPKSNCDQEFRWDNDPGYTNNPDSFGQLQPDSQGRRPGIYARLEGPLNNWTKDQIDFNLRQLPFTADLLVTTLDTKSIMMYHFEPWMLVQGEHSSCYTPENVVLSAVDIQAAETVYPGDSALAKAVASSKLNAVKQLVDIPSLSAETRSYYKKQARELVQAAQ